MPCLSDRIVSLVLAAAVGLGMGCHRSEPASEANSDSAAANTKTESVAGGMVTAQKLIAGKTGRGNRLLKEASPYLLLHAHNPVDWYPWGPEAFAKAKAENKLVFLSIGYSSCYWCHVMERETFMDDEVAAFLNAHFVAIKVDREERPDVDEVYITAMQALRAQTGWPLSVFLLPDGRPIPAGGTYFPPRDRDGRPGFLTLIQAIDRAWQENPDRFRSDAEKVTEAVRTALRNRAGRLGMKPGAEMLTAVQDALAGIFDPEYGGFGFAPDEPHRPKFPEPPNLLFLIDRLRRGAGDEIRLLLTTTLDRMAAGGIRDHVGGGFHRYSTDRFWRIPHFEKMLYDNGQLATVYAEAFALTKRPEYRRVVVELLEFVERELTTPQGVFYTALDAESEAEEGRYYAWDADDLRRVAGDEFAFLQQAYGVGTEPNFVAPHGDGKARHVLLTAEPPDKLAEKLKVTEPALADRWGSLRGKLLAARSQRPRPLTDTKVLTSWNGLMIRGYADAGRLLGETRYTAAAAKAAEFLLANARGADGRLFRSIHDGQPRLNAFLDDYANLIDGLIALHRATNEARWLEAADKLQQKQDELFWDQELDGYFQTANDHESLIARSKQAADNVLPSANAVSAGNLLYLARGLDKAEYRQRADQTIWSFARLAAEFPGEMPRMAMAVAELLEVAAPK